MESDDQKKKAREKTREQPNFIVHWKEQNNNKSGNDSVSDEKQGTTKAARIVYLRGSSEMFLRNPLKGEHVNLSLGGTTDLWAL